MLDAAFKRDGRSPGRQVAEDLGEDGFRLEVPLADGSRSPAVPLVVGVDGVEGHQTGR